MNEENKNWEEISIIQKELIEKLTCYLDEESVKEIRELFEVGENEMSCEGLFLSFIKENIYPDPFEFEEYKSLVKSLDLDNKEECVFDDYFWERFLKWGKGKKIMTEENKNWHEINSKLKELIEKLICYLDEQPIRGVTHLFKDSELEMSCEELFLQFIEGNIYPDPFEFEEYKYLVKSLDLNKENFLDDDFWEKFLKWGKENTNS